MSSSCSFHFISYARSGLFSFLGERGGPVKQGQGFAVMLSMAAMAASQDVALDTLLTCDTDGLFSDLLRDFEATSSGSLKRRASVNLAGEKSKRTSRENLSPFSFPRRDSENSFSSVLRIVTMGTDNEKEPEGVLKESNSNVGAASHGPTNGPSDHASPMLLKPASANPPSTARGTDAECEVNIRF